MSKKVRTRILQKADTIDSWTRASENGFKVLDREAIFYTDADTAKYPISRLGFKDKNFFMYVANI